ncbi:hypothetical protein HDC37_001332 [Microbacterium sp. AK009]|nr:hypothetical protein [Microbacterium sp. AK009]
MFILHLEVMLGATEIYLVLNSECRAADPAMGEMEQPVRTRIVSATP